MEQPANLAKPARRLAGGDGTVGVDKCPEPIPFKATRVDTNGAQSLTG